MYIIGITGGVGCGKSEVLSYLRDRWEFRVMELDRIGHTMLLPGSPCFDRVCELFGPSVLRPDGTIDRGAVASLVFRDEALLGELNAIVHPAIRDEAVSQLGQLAEAGTAFCAVEAALLLEVKFDALCDETWYIYADTDVRKRRLAASRGYSEERIRSMMERQLDEQVFRSRCGTVIDNSGDLLSTREQIDGRMREILSSLKGTLET